MRREGTEKASTFILPSREKRITLSYYFFDSLLTFL